MTFSSAAARSWLVAAGVTLLGVVLALNFATPGKKLERVPRHLYPIANAAFQREMGVMLGPTVLQGNRVTALQNGVEIFPAMLDAISAARRSVNFETYIYWSGETGKRFTAALIERAMAGIPVNLTIDWVGSVKMDADELSRLQTAGVRVHRYRPLHWYNISRINNRTHRKLLIVDGAVGFTGGVGIADQWEGNAEHPRHWRDIHFRIEGPAVAQLQAAFNDNWVKMTGNVLNGDAYFPAMSTAGELGAHVFIASPSGGSESMRLMYLLAVAATAQSLDIAASYFVPDTLLIQSILEARQRGVRVRILLPGPHTDSAAVALASKQDWGQLLEAGVEIFECQPTMLHTKMLIGDGYLVSVGSTNLDSRSLNLNDEANLNVYDRAFAQQMTGVFERDLADAHPYGYEQWKNRPWSERLSELLIAPAKSQL
ncbi:MAG: phospholipase D-like domain-containing protein [Steroidobacteraceae bacterium]